ncbi:MAG: NADH-quinone oxidoreductase subunit NuoK [Nitrospirota bacterium]|nr:NADH-quinone oxidoreductase subunit NuoK [Nitrospirota bacterium]
MTVPISYYLVLSAIVFLTGLVGVLIRRNIIIILLSVELMLNATNINFVAFSHHFHNVTGQVFVFFALTVAAAEVAVGLAIIIALYRSKSSINVDEFQLLKW